MVYGKTLPNDFFIKHPCPLCGHIHEEGAYPYVTYVFGQMSFTCQGCKGIVDGNIKSSSSSKCLIDCGEAWKGNYVKKEK